MNQEEIDNLKKLITKSEIESVIKTKTKTPYKRKFRTRWLHSWILPNIQRRTYTDPSQTLPKDWRGGNTPKDILWSHHHPDTKIRQRHYQKNKITGQIFDEQQCKNPQQNISKLNATHKKNQTPWSSWNYAKDTRMLQNSQINQCDTQHWQKEE